jgi:hypothetical protein
MSLFDKYVHGDIDRRAFADRAAVGLLDALNPRITAS